MLYAGLWSKIQKKRPLGVSTAPESGIKREDGIQDIKPALTPPSSPPGLSLTVGDEMDIGGGTMGQLAPQQPVPVPRRILYDPTLYPPTKPVVPKKGRARALDFEPTDDPPTKKRRVDPPPKVGSTSAPPPPQPKQVTLFTANKSGPITRTRDGKFVPVPALPKPFKWNLSSEERAGLGLEPSIVPGISSESQSRDEESSSRTLDSTLYPDLNTPRNQVGRRSDQSSSQRVDYMQLYGSQVQALLQMRSTKSRITSLSLRITRTTTVICVWAPKIGTYVLLRFFFFHHGHPSPQDTRAESTSTSSWTRPSFLNMSRDGKDLDLRYNGPFLSLFIPPWLLVSLKPGKQTPTVTKGISLTLRVEEITQSNEIDTHDGLDTWTRRFRGTSDIELWDVDDLSRLLPRSMKLKSLFHRLSVMHDAPDRERVVLQDLGSSLAANSQVRILHLLSKTYQLMTPPSSLFLPLRNCDLTTHPSIPLVDAIADYSCSLREAISFPLTLEYKSRP